VVVNGMLTDKTPISKGNQHVRLQTRCIGCGHGCEAVRVSERSEVEASGDAERSTRRAEKEMQKEARDEG
jgi:hypothetical protein